MAYFFAHAGRGLEGDVVAGLAVDGSAEAVDPATAFDASCPPHVGAWVFPIGAAAFGAAAVFSGSGLSLMISPCCATIAYSGMLDVTIFLMWLLM